MASILVTELTTQTQLRQRVEEDITGSCKENKGTISKGAVPEQRRGEDRLERSACTQTARHFVEEAFPLISGLSNSVSAGNKGKGI